MRRTRCCSRVRVAAAKAQVIALTAPHPMPLRCAVVDVGCKGVLLCVFRAGRTPREGASLTESASPVLPLRSAHRLPRRVVIAYANIVDNDVMAAASIYRRSEDAARNVQAHRRFLRFIRHAGAETAASLPTPFAPFTLTARVGQPRTAHPARVHDDGHRAAQDELRAADAQAGPWGRPGDVAASLRRQAGGHIAGNAARRGACPAPRSPSPRLTLPHGRRHSGRAVQYALSSLVDDILSLAKIEAGKLELRMEAFSVTEAVRSVVFAMTGLSKSRHVRIVCQLPRHMPDMIGDHVRVRCGRWTQGRGRSGR